MRRYDLDWLRVIVFGLLIFYHVGMFFVPWEWHIKNQDLYQWLEYPMMFLNQWRLPILFVISGMGTSYALAKRSGKQFATERIKRLLIPLVAGIAIVVPPQVYFERLSSGAFTGSYLDFWPFYAFTGVYPEGNFSWHHLWFLPYLLTFSLVLTPVFLYLRKHKYNKFTGWLSRQVSTPAGFLWFIIPLYLTNITLKPYFPETHALWGDWFTIAHYIILFFYGFILISVKDIFWKTVQLNRRMFLAAGIIFFSSWMAFRLYLPEALYFNPLVKVLNAWSWILAIFGYAGHYLNRENRFLPYANEAVYPFYILHQTITVALAFYIKDLEWGFFSKFSFLVAGTFGLSFIVYEYLIRRNGFIRPFFGLKKKKSKERLKLGKKLVNV